jgi:hypothetical protein
MINNISLSLIQIPELSRKKIITLKGRLTVENIMDIYERILENCNSKENDYEFNIMSADICDLSFVQLLYSAVKYLNRKNRTYSVKSKKAFDNFLEEVGYLRTVTAQNTGDVVPNWSGHMPLHKENDNG